MTWTRDYLERAYFALEAYHGILSDALRAHLKARGDDHGAGVLRQGLRDTERQINDLKAELCARF